MTISESFECTLAEKFVEPCRYDRRLHENIITTSIFTHPPPLDSPEVSYGELISFTTLAELLNMRSHILKNLFDLMQRTYHWAILSAYREILERCISLSLNSIYIPHICTFLYELFV